MKQPVKVIVGGFELLVSGTTVSTGLQTVDIYPVDAIFSIRLIYRTVPDAVPTIQTGPFQNGQAQVIATNIDLNTGIASSTPIHVANWSNRKMYFSFSCHLMGSPTTGTRLTAYSVYLGEASNG
jgi:hypothetical protein